MSNVKPGVVPETAKPRWNARDGTWWVLVENAEREYCADCRLCPVQLWELAGPIPGDLWLCGLCIRKRGGKRG